MSSSPPANSSENASEDELPKSKFRLHLDDLRHPGTGSFLTLVPDPLLTIKTALRAIVKHLYTAPPPGGDSTSPPSFIPSVPPTKSVTLIVREFGGLAYTTGNQSDKEIHLSLNYIQSCTRSKDPAGELNGVLTHELVHCYQHTRPASEQAPEGEGSPPSGLTEGIADFVRLKSGLKPPHWKRPLSSGERPTKWDQGYQHTAYFLSWLEDVRAGAGSVGAVNDRLLRVGYVQGLDNHVALEGSEGVPEKSFWQYIFGVGVLQLWEEYGEYLDRSGHDEPGGENGNWEIELL